MTVLTFDRWDFLGTRILLVALGLLSAVFGIVVPVVQWLTGASLEWELATTDAGRAPAGLDAADGTRLTGVGRVLVSIDDASTGAWMATLLPGVLLALAAITIVVLVLRLLTRIQRGDPFVTASVTALRLIGATVLAAALFATGAGALADAVVRSAALRDDGSVGISFDLPLVGVLGALLVLALAEAFAHGARLRADVEGLV